MRSNGREPTTAVSAWGVRWRPAPAARIRLLCVPPAGTGAAMFRSWGDALAPDVEVIAVRLPGRETRFGEAPLTRIDDVVPKLVDGLGPWLAAPHAWFGHSMGALLAFEACRMTVSAGLMSPSRLIVACHPAPHLVERRFASLGPSDDDLVSYLEQSGSVPRQIRESPAFAAFLPTLRADIEVLRTYRHRPGPALDLPVTVYGGESDDGVSVGELAAWAEHSGTGCELRMLPGDHFFPRQDPGRLLAAIAAELA
ncbi:alpha/beta fold hydrolase [Solwaraspora sp. WMMD1047]|uniref:thioesterase II family protein n=1 Tax=Solwaraspora sp. WMMD1047 TaxID=3016102 RepID=UPI00241678F8|nr:alpha/beta fold hydrolase [Solwaraspora sp. WMMD1047]MDG4830627.1 alpha/beta fold hydrolase [Solwaraspora sp. WMMD1047]